VAHYCCINIHNDANKPEPGHSPHENGGDLSPRVIDLPEELDQEIARIKLETMGLEIDSLTEEQVAYATDYAAGT